MIITPETFSQELLLNHSNKNTIQCIETQYNLLYSLLSKNEINQCINIIGNEKNLEKEPDITFTNLINQLFLAEIKLKLGAIEIANRIAISVANFVLHKLNNNSQNSSEILYLIHECMIKLNDLELYSKSIELFNMLNKFHFQQDEKNSDQITLIKIEYALVLLKINSNNFLPIYSILEQNANKENHRISFQFNFLKSNYDFKNNIPISTLPNVNCPSFENRVELIHLLVLAQEVSKSKNLANKDSIYEIYLNTKYYLNKIRILCLYVHLFQHQNTKEDLVFWKSINLSLSFSILIKNDLIFNRYNSNNLIDNKNLICLKINQENISEINYFQSSNATNMIDLVSGIIFYDNRTQYLLTPQRTKFLIFLISSGSQGIHLNTAIDLLLDGTYLYYESAFLRIKNLIIELKKLGIHIYRKNNYYFYSFEMNKYNILLPDMNYTSSPINFLAKNFDIIDRNVIQQSLKIKPSTASLYLKKWRQIGLIEKKPTNRFGEFTIIKEKLSNAN